MELYKDNESAANATKEVESIRRNADYLGAAITLGAFAGNEVARLTLRAPLFKLRPQNCIFWLVAPMLFSRKASESQIHERIDSLWAIHENRQKQGLGGTYKSNGLYSDREHN
jgi:hypothetical protein